jgi:hypothetical protein
MTAVLAAAPALPLHTAGKYVAAAYIVFVALILVYVAIIAIRLSHNEREISELTREVLAKQEAERAAADADALEREHVA